jgi:CheY-like chemotaxis protein
MPTALIVEDEPEANKLLSILVQLQGYGTHSAYTGGEALARIAAAPPDIVFLDLMLPDINGYEVCKALKSRKDTTLIPVVMVTARVAVDNRDRSYSVGADQYVSKPYTPDQIFQALADANEWRRQAEQHEGAFEVCFESDDEGESLRQISQLRSLMLAFTPLDYDAISRMTAAFQEIWKAADDWGRRNGKPVVASLSYETLGDRVVLTLHDLAGWFRDDPRSPAERWPAAIALGGFDEVRVEQPGDSVAFVMRFSSDGSARDGSA